MYISTLYIANINVAIYIPYISQLFICDLYIYVTGEYIYIYIKADIH